MKFILTLEKYFGYSDFTRKWGSPEEMREDVESCLNRLLPKTDMISGITDQSTEKGIKFEIILTTKEIIHMYKISQWRFSPESGYEYYLGKKKFKFNDLKSKLEEDHLDKLEAFLKYFKSFDFYSQYIDNGGQYKAASTNNNSIKLMFDELNKSDKKKAKKEILKHFNSKELLIRIDQTFVL